MVFKCVKILAWKSERRRPIGRSRCRREDTVSMNAKFESFAATEIQVMVFRVSQPSRPRLVL
jgi:hypothetical protein